MSVFIFFEPASCLNTSKTMTTATADIALIGLAVMGKNLIMNMNDHGFTVCAFNRTVSKVDEFLQNEAKGTNIIGRSLVCILKIEKFY